MRGTIVWALVHGSVVPSQKPCRTRTEDNCHVTRPSHSRHALATSVILKKENEILSEQCEHSSCDGPFWSLHEVRAPTRQGQCCPGHLARRTPSSTRWLWRRQRRRRIQSTSPGARLNAGSEGMEVRRDLNSYVETTITYCTYSPIIFPSIPILTPPTADLFRSSPPPPPRALLPSSHSHSHSPLCAIIAPMTTHPAIHQQSGIDDELVVRAWSATSQSHTR